MALIFPAPAQIKNLLDPTDNTDAVTKIYVDTLIGSGVDIAVGNVAASGNVNANVITSNAITTTGNLVATNANLGNLVTANYISGNGSLLTSINGSNVTGTVANANYAGYAGNITVSSQPNITSVGTLTSLSVTGNVSGNNFTVNGNLTVLGSTLTVNNEIVNQTETITGNLVAGNVSFTGSNVSLGSVANLHITGGNSNDVLKTDGSGNLSWGSVSAGTLTADVDSFTGDGSTVSFSLANTPAGENFTMVAVQGVLQPKTTYSLSGKVLTFDSAPPNTAIVEVTTFGGSVVSGGGSSTPAFAWNIASSNATMSANNGYFVDTSTAAKTMTLPSSPVLGDTIRINDLAGTFGTNNLTVARNGQKIQGITQDLLVDTAQTSFGLVFSNSTYGWKVLEL